MDNLGYDDDADSLGCDDGGGDVDGVLKSLVLGNLCVNRLCGLLLCLKSRLQSFKYVN